MIQLADKDGEISQLLDKISDQQKDFQSLQETKAALDTEIAVYRKLMETEEDRMGISETGQGHKKGTDHKKGFFSVLVERSDSITPDLCKTEKTDIKPLKMAQTIL